MESSELPKYMILRAPAVCIVEGSWQLNVRSPLRGCDNVEVWGPKTRR